MKKMLFLIVAVIIILISPTNIIFSQEKKLGTHITLEEEEIAQIENGKEVTKAYVSDSFEEKEQIISEAKKRGRSVRVKKLNRPRIKFFNDQGDVIKEIKLSHRGELASEEQLTKKHPNAGEIRINRRIQRWAALSGNKKAAVVIEDVNENKIPETAVEEQKMLKTGGGGLSLKSYLYFYNSNGETLWTKLTPENTGIENVALSDDGEIIAYTQVFVSGDLQADEPYEKISIVNRSGQSVFNFPPDSGTDYRIYADPELVMSKNGRYVSVRGEQKGQDVQIYIDTVNKTVWAAPHQYLAIKISIAGIARLSHPDLKESDPQQLDLKKHLGE